MEDVYKNIKEYNLNKEHKILIMIWLLISNKKLNPIAIELFIRGGKLNISLVFITQSYLAVPKNVKLNSTHYFIMKIPNNRKFQQIAFNHSSDNEFEDLKNLHKKCAEKHNPLCFIENLLGGIWKLIMTIDD